MSGILDKKSRIIDAMLTVEGRRQMSDGSFNVSYVTFSDSDVVYMPDATDGHVDPTTRIYLEASNLPQDEITFKANDEGSLVPFRIQDIKLSPVSGNVSNSQSPGILKDGRLTMYQYHHGRRVKVGDVGIKEDPEDDYKGFIYSDTTGLTASVLIDSKLVAGTVKAQTPFMGKPYVAYVGTRGGLGPSQFAQVISGAISRLQTIGGPQVSATAINDSVYLDSGENYFGTKIFATGTLSSPLLIETSAIGGNLLVDEVQNAAFASQIQGIFTASFDNFKNLQTLATIDRLFEDQNFLLSSNEMTFDLSRVASKITTAFKYYPPSVNSIDSLFNDDKMSHLENFKYLPPIVKTSDSAVVDKTDINNLTDYYLGDYPSWGNNESKLTYSQLMNQLADFEDVKKPIVFTTSLKNNIVAQFFEVIGASGRVKKLDVVEFGDVVNPANNTTNKVFFVGKTYLDNRGTVCFVNMFTLIFSNVPKNEVRSG